MFLHILIARLYLLYLFAADIWATALFSDHSISGALDTALSFSADLVAIAGLIALMSLADRMLFLPPMGLPAQQRERLGRAGVFSANIVHLFTLSLVADQWYAIDAAWAKLGIDFPAAIVAAAGLLVLSAIAAPRLALWLEGRAADADPYPLPAVRGGTAALAVAGALALISRYAGAAETVITSGGENVVAAIMLMAPELALLAALVLVTIAARRPSAAVVSPFAAVVMALMVGLQLAGPLITTALSALLSWDLDFLLAYVTEVSRTTQSIALVAGVLMLMLPFSAARLAIGIARR